MEGSAPTPDGKRTQVSEGPRWLASRARRIRSVLVMVAILVLTACSGGEKPSEGEPSTQSETSTEPTAPPSADVFSPLPGAVIDGRFPVADDGRQLALSCWGEGSPIVVLEDGHPSEQGGRFQFGRTGGAFLNALLAHTRVCAYDRAGYAASDPAPLEPRTADDVIGDLHALLAAAEIAGPYVLVGSSFGGMIVTYYAARHPEDVAGVVLLDVPAPTDTLTLEEIPELAWDHPLNPEHVDVIPEFESRFANERLPIQAPLTVITASDGQSSAEDQSIWLELNPAATQVQLVGDHDIYLSDAAGVAVEVVKLL